METPYLGGVVGTGPGGGRRAFVDGLARDVESQATLGLLVYSIILESLVSCNLR